MRRLLIKNFFAIKNADINLKSFNIFIGPQAAGKSLVAKTCYYFQDIITRIFLFGIKDGGDKRIFNKKAKEAFLKHFPNYGDGYGELYIEYNYYDTKITIESTKSGSSINVNYYGDLLKIRDELKQKYKKMDNKKDIFLFDDDPKFSKLIQYINESPELSKLFQVPVFIPSARSFFSTIKSNVFSFLKESVELDPFMKSFGSYYEISRRVYENRRLYLIEEKDNVYNEILEKMKKILTGEYYTEKEEDWIKLDNRRVRLSNASSGQQESLPMLLVLLSFPFLNFNGLKNKSFFIEEPEAHLFPHAQKEILYCLLLVHNIKNFEITLTTHSPYILSYINNSILYNKVLKNIKKDSIKKEFKEKFNEIIGLNIENVAAYSVKNGTVHDITDLETDLIGGDLMDDLSVKLDEEYSNMLDYLSINEEE